LSIPEDDIPVPPGELGLMGYGALSATESEAVPDDSGRVAPAALAKAGARAGASEPDGLITPEAVYAALLARAAAMADRPDPMALSGRQLVVKELRAAAPFIAADVRVRAEAAEAKLDAIKGQHDEWAVAWGSDGVNDGIGFVECYDDEEDAREHLQWYAGGSVVRRTRMVTAWEIAPEGAGNA
jgi:hypothetical protein